MATKKYTAKAVTAPRATKLKTEIKLPDVETFSRETAGADVEVDSAMSDQSQPAHMVIDLTVTDIRDLRFRNARGEMFKLDDYRSGDVFILKAA